MSWRSARLEGLRGSLLRHGGRTVLMTYPGLRVGNYLYFALHAYQSIGRGHDYRVLDTGLDPAWYFRFPALRDLLIHRVRLRDRREYIPELFYQHYGKDFDYEDLRRFIAHVLKPGELSSGDRAMVTVNVRRGDYYSSAERRAELGFDISHYLATALDQAGAEEEVSRIRLVSDEPEWAAQAVARIRPRLRIAEIVRGGPVEHFEALSGSARLILANSSFSYWGAYVSMVRHAPERISVYAPDLSVRTKMDGRAWQLDPSWTVITTCPDQGLDD